MAETEKPAMSRSNFKTHLYGVKCEQLSKSLLISKTSSLVSTINF